MKDTRYRIVRVTYDDGAFGYTAEPFEEVVAERIDRAQAKSIYRHYTDYEKLAAEGCWYGIDYVEYSIEEQTDDGVWRNISRDWAYREQEEFEAWCSRNSLNAYAIMAGYR